MTRPAAVGVWRVVWFGSSGPFYYDDGVDVIDDELLYDGIAALPQSAVVTNGQLDVALAPTLDPHVLRLADVGVLVGVVYTTLVKADNSLDITDDLSNCQVEYVYITSSAAAERTFDAIDDGTAGQVKIFILGDNFINFTDVDNRGTNDSLFLNQLPALSTFNGQQGDIIAFINIGGDGAGGAGYWEELYRTVKVK